MSTPADRTLAARAAAASRWGRCADRAEATKPARAGLRAKFEREVDPDGTLDPAERAYRADQLMRAHMLRMSIAAKKARAAATRASGSKRPKAGDAAGARTTDAGADA